MRLLSNNSIQAPYCAFHHKDAATGNRCIWLMLGGLLYGSNDDGATWHNAYSSGTTAPMDGGLYNEGLFVSSAGRVFVSGGANQRIRYADLAAGGQLLAAPGTFADVLCSDEEHMFVGPGKAGAASGAYVQHWAMWEIEYPWEAVGGLEIGDIVCGLYHRSTDQVTACTITAGGTGYSDSFAVTFSGGGGSGAAGTATAVGGVIQSVDITWGGTGYTSVPTAVFTAGGGSSATASVNTGRKRAFIYVIRNNDDGVPIINAGYNGGNADSYAYMAPDALAPQGDPFAAWNVQMGLIARHIHHLTMGTDGHLYFTCGDQAVGINWAPGDTGNHYRFCRMYPGAASFEALAGAGNGFTSMLLRDDGTLLCGNDVDAYGTGQTQYIERWKDGVKIDRPYTPFGAIHDWPVWNIVEVGDWGSGTGVLYASVQRPGDLTKAGNSCALLLKSTDGGATWARAAESGPYPTSTNWCDFDFIACDRRRRIPTGAAQFLITTQPQLNADGRYYTVVV